MILRILLYVKGYLQITLKGFEAERFLNICAKKGILLWNFKHVEQGYECYIGLKDFWSLKPILKKTKMKITILKKQGLPFFLYRNRRRKMFFAGIFLCTILIYCMSLFIWDIDVEGNYSQTDEVLLEALSKVGVTHGVLKGNINSDYIEEYIRTEFADIIWDSAEIKGTRLILRVRENTDLRLMNQEEAEVPSNLVANRDGRIVSMVTRRGTPMVAVGQEIKAGDLLVEGAIPVINDSGDTISYQYTAADSDIFIQTQYDFQASFPNQYQKKNYTGRKKKRYFVALNQTAFSFGLDGRKFKAYDMVSEQKQWKLWNHFYLPIYTGRMIQQEYETKTETHSKESANAYGKQLFQQFTDELFERGIQIQEKTISIQQSGKAWKVRGSVTVIEKTGKRVAGERYTIPEADSQEEED